MKKFIFKSTLFITLIFTLSFGVLIFGIEDTQAQAGLKNFVPQVEIPGLGSNMSVGEKVPGSEDMVQSTLLRDYVVGIYNYSFAIAGILAAIVLMGGGVYWLISGGSPDKIGKAKKIIGSSLAGLALLFGSHLILNTINPDLLKMKALTFKGVEGEKELVPALACCACYDDDGTIKLEQLIEPTECYSSVGLTEEECRKKCNPNADNYVLSNENKERSKYIYKKAHVCGSGENENKCIIAFGVGNNPHGFRSNEWRFQAGIKNQIGDMSPELVKFLNCMSENFPVMFTGEISSISDNKHIGNLSACNQSSCTKTNKDDPDNCVHACQSCHYGGGLNTNKSYAVDFGDEANRNIYYRAADDCAKILNTSYNKVYHDDHVHISIPPCPYK